MNSAHRIAALHTTDFSIKKKERRKRRWLGAQHTGGPSRCPSPRTWGNRTPARSTAGRKLCRRLLGSNSPWQHRPSCQEAISLPALPATGLLIQKAPSTDAPAQQPATPGCNPSLSKFCNPKTSAPRFAAPTGSIKLISPSPNIILHVTLCPQLARGTGGLPSPHSPPHHNRLQGWDSCRVGTTRFPIPPNAKGQGKRRKTTWC